MKNIPYHVVVFTIVVSILVISCSSETGSTTSSNPPIRVLAIESFLADIAQNIAGDRVQVTSLIPEGIDPHTYQPSPQDMVALSEAQIVIMNGAHLEDWLAKTLENAGGNAKVVEASLGLTSRTASANEVQETDHVLGDPHFWLDPVYAIKYAENIRDCFIAADPAGKEIYKKNTDSYIAKLKLLDTWIKEQISVIPPEKRILVTNHESFGYFADRYDFKVVGTIIPGTSSEAAPSAHQISSLIEVIRKSGAKAIFLETGTNPQIADQIARETGIKTVTNLQTHSTGSIPGAEPGYIGMMKWNVSLIVQALKD